MAEKKTITMEKKILDYLEEFGINHFERTVYLLLAKTDVPMKVRDISIRLRINKVQIYRVLEKLQNKGLIEIVLEKPALFKAVPFEKVLTNFIHHRRRILDSIESEKNALTDYLKNTPKKRDDSFTTSEVYIVKGKRITDLAFEVSRKAKEVCMLTPISGLISTDLEGTYDGLDNYGVKFRFLIPSTPKAAKTEIKLLRKLNSYSNIAIRQVEIDCQISSFGTTDRQQSILFLNNLVMSEKVESVALVIENKLISKLMSAYFDELWASASSI